MEYKQEMPPPGGYKPMTYDRVPLKTFFKPKITLACMLGFSGFNIMLYHQFKRATNNERIEMRCAKQAIIPMLYAEIDRMLLKQLRKNREMEEEVMKEVKGWEVGKWKHYPVYLSIDPDEYFKPYFMEYFAHSENKDLHKYMNVIFHT